MSNREAAAAITAERGNIQVLNALEILERAALGPGSQGTAADFLKCLGEGGMLVIANPLVAPLAEPCSHRIADARNPAVQSGYVCVDCLALFTAADHLPVAAQPAASGVDALWVKKAARLADNAINAHATWFAECALGELSNFHMPHLESEKDEARDALRAHLSTAAKE
jgi:hypothetical protein